MSRLISRPLRQLASEAASIQAFDFASPVATRSLVTEIDDLAVTMDAMKHTIRRVLEIAATIAGERHFGRLLERVLAETMSSAGAVGGAIDLLDEAGRTVQQTASPAPEEASRDLGQRAVAERRTILERVTDRTAMAVPLRNRADEVIGALRLTLLERPEAVPRPLVAFIEALSGTAAVAIENQRLLQAQKDLLDSFIKLVAQAIDAKSPYTGGHCQRVPELTRMLAQAACAATDGPFRDFTLSEDEWEALHIACWLHDCGKVTTPEYVVDKATKLETLYDRLHEIRMRFEVLKRDAEIEFWKKVAAGGDRDRLRPELEAEWRALDSEFAFVAECNEGGEYMAPDRVERLQRIARRTWMRTLDDRIGISQDELMRKRRSPEVARPARETLLADKPEHILERGTGEMAAADDAWGFRLEVPPVKYNRGEIYNLCIGRGTLTEEERYAINDHIVQTIVMLSALPFPRHLRAVPEMAGGHHEKMDGTGYPKRLRREDLSLPARMMAIADIFEALTARDRPYKKGKTLSEALEIMGYMKRDGHIDPDLLDLFVTSGVYRRYAEQFLDPEQIDEVDAPLTTA
jgi:HD-GYP domain-containing protein (c-di-GMP phosphodiesterase class II)